MGRMIRASGWHHKAQRSQAWCCHRDQQRRLALTSSAKISQTRAHKLVTGEADGYFVHTPMVGATREDRVSAMSSYAAFLRGMNVGGHRIGNEELRARFTAMGFADVATFRASGNVVFAGVAQPLEQVQAHIEEGLADAL